MLILDLIDDGIRVFKVCLRGYLNLSRCEGCCFDDAQALGNVNIAPGFSQDLSVPRTHTVGLNYQSTPC